MSDIDYARYDRIRPIRWTGDALELLDQRKLPFATEYLTCRNSDEVAAAIHALAHARSTLRSLTRRPCSWNPHCSG